jgi:hypothetical protein
LGSLITAFQSHLAMLHGRSGYCAPGKAKMRERCHAHLTLFYIFNWSLGSLISVS